MINKYAKCMDNIKPSFIREISKLIDDPSIISFAGGMPSSDFFPIEEMKEACLGVLDKDGKAALQYNATDGLLPLREKIAKRLQTTVKVKGITSNNIIITSGSQQGIDFSGRLFLNAEDIVVCERPSFIGAINAFRMYGCKFIDIALEEDGMKMDDLESALSSNPKIKFIYAIPDFQNPTGRSWSLEKRRKIVELAEKYNVIIIEDNPYYELRYDGKMPPLIKSFDTSGKVILLGTFSKIISPGIRVGWICASNELIGKYNLLKQSADLQTSSLSQRQLNYLLDNFNINQHIEDLKKEYRKKRDLMLENIRSYFPENIKVTGSEGGLFLWLELPKHIDTTKLVEKALEKGVAYVPGEFFFANGGGHNTLRLNFSSESEEKITEGIKRLSEIIREFV